MIKGIIFDLDGVIVSTDDLHYLGWKMIANRENIHFDKTINHQLRGVSRMESLNILLNHSFKVYSQTEKMQLASMKNDYYVSLLGNLSQSDLLPGALELIKYLKRKNYLLAIGSSSKNASIIIDKLNIREYFNVIVDGNDISNSKPHPEVFLTAANKLGLTSAECVVIEDAVTGIDAAKAANMITYGIGSAKNYENTDFGIDSLYDLIDTL